ncbi:TlpA disulfide reductase family protein [Gordonia jinhuaensis]|nr:TlpA disulfide reductase family protein [Gordonia jinhuaensis]
MVLGVTACSTGDDAVSQGDTFQFVSPNGKTEIFYNPPSERKHIRDLSGPDLLTGNTIHLSDFAGKVVVINVWASWCGPCRTESDDLEQTYAATKDRGVAFLGIDFRDDKGSAQDFVRNRNVAYPSIYDYGGRSLVALTTPTSVVPTTVVLDRDHRAAAVFLRTVNSDELTTLVQGLAAEQENRS